MTNAETIVTKKTGYRLRAVVAMAASLFLMALLAAKPAHAADFTVTNTTDPGDGLCNASGCSLREAITAANANPGPDTIKFNIPQGFAGPQSGVMTIGVSKRLPAITEVVTTGGYTQPGATKNTDTVRANAKPLIELNGQNAGAGASGLQVLASNTTVRGLVINRFGGNGIDVCCDGKTGVKIEGNFIGTDPSGTIDLGNSFSGVELAEALNSTVGGSTPEARNLISGNWGPASFFRRLLPPRTTTRFRATS